VSPACLGFSASVVEWRLGRAAVLERAVNKEGVEEERSWGLSKAREEVPSRGKERVGKN
jgi:hypothetical protein